MKKYLSILVAALTLWGCQQKQEAVALQKPSNQIVFGQIDSLYSDILGESRKVWVHVPESAGGDRTYPVLYLLDGPGHFYSVVGMIKQLSTTNGNTVVPEMIIVAIPNTDRGRDLTPTKVDVDVRTGKSFPFASGGGDRFLDFIESELIPYIDRSYPSAPYRTYVGHSFGGLSVINALVTRPHLFNNYVAIDPSLWWDDQAFLKDADSILSVNRFDKKALYVGVANTMREGMDINIVQNDTTNETAHIRSILTFGKSLETKDNGLQFEWKYYPDDSHGSVPLITEYDAMRFLFSWHPFKDEMALYDENSGLTITDAIQLITTHYDKVASIMGYEVRTPEAVMNDWGYYYMMNDRMDWAVAFFDWNIQHYPYSSNVYDSRGDCFLAQGDSAQALTYFRKALEVGDNDYSQAKIDRLEEHLTE